MSAMRRSWCGGRRTRARVVGAARPPLRGPHCLALLAVAGLLTAAASAAAQVPLTVPERTDYQRTSTVAEVQAFLDSLQAAGAPITVGEMGRTAGGRPIPFVIASEPRVTSPREAARAGKLVVYLQANIHGGEVEGKEAVQMLLRELAGPRRSLLERLVVLVAPVYNGDGNDALGPVEENRPGQGGPPMVGLRPDGRNLDLNRDYLKAEAPETRASLTRVYDTWDPALMMDLHTTDGTLHGYLLTYSPPLNPNAPPGPVAFAQDTMLPAVRAAMQAKYDEPVFPYGNVRNPLEPEAWITYSPMAWYGTNYVGMRGRIAILSEAYSHSVFKTRVKATHDFVVEVLEYAAAHAGRIRALVAEADRATTLEGASSDRPELGVDFEPVSRGVEPVVLREVRRVAVEGSRRPRYEPTGRMKTVDLTVYDRFAATRTRTLPAGYFLSPGDGDIAELLRLHGIQVRRTEADWTGTAEVYRADSLSWGPGQFQGHSLLNVAGDYEASTTTVPAGSYYISTAQPLGRLVFELLEPEGWGLPRWGFFDRRLGREFGPAPVTRLPIWRVAAEPGVAMRVVR